MDSGESIKVNVKEKDGQKIDGDQETMVFSGTVKADGTAELKPLETKEDWNEEK